MGASLGVSNLTSATTQNRSDEEISSIVKSGRGKMPGFDLPQDTRAELVRLIRLFGGAPPTAPPSSGAAPASARPEASAAPPAPSASN